MDTANTCLAAGIDAYKTLALYTHIIPAALAVFLSVFVLYKAKFSFLSKSFSLFLILFTVWLVGDLMTWAQTDYYITSFNWAYLDYVNVAFVLAALYFFLCIIKEKDIELWYRIFLFALSIPAFIITMSGTSIFNFNVPVCEATENLFLTNYKFAVEIFSILVIALAGSIEYIKGDVPKKRQIIFLGSSLAFFILIFGGTEYISSVTDIYEINLYSLLILPIFLFIITFSITNLQIFKIRFIETQLLVFVLIIMTSSQLLFVEGIADISLSLVSLLISVFISFVLLKNVSEQSKQRRRIEELASQLESSNEKLKGLDKLKTEFLSLASHQLRSPLTAIKGYSSMLIENSFGDITEQQKEPLNRIFESTNHLVKVVEDLLNISKIEQGGLTYEMSKFDMKKVVTDFLADFSISAANKHLTITYDDDNQSDYIVYGDQEKLRQVILNLIDNSIKYTNEGGVHLNLSHDTASKSVILKIKDTGIGMDQETKSKLFGKFSRGAGGAKLNTGGSGLGLYLAKQIVEAHKGSISVDSEGEDKGSTFTLSLKIDKQA